MTDVPLSEKRLDSCTFLAIRQAAPTSSLSQVWCYCLSWIPWLLRTCANIPVNLSCSRADALAGTSSEVVRDTLGSLPPADRSADFPDACGSLKFADIFLRIVLRFVLAVAQLWVPGCLSGSYLPTLLVRGTVHLRTGSWGANGGFAVHPFRFISRAWCSGSPGIPTPGKLR